MNDQRENHAREIELKLEAAPADMKQLKRNLAQLGKIAPLRAPEKLHSVYFDTRQLDLCRAGLLWRVRTCGNRHIQTVKQIDGPAAGLFNRGEWEREIAGAHPDLAAADEFGFKPSIMKKLHDGIKPIFRTEIDRSEYEIGDDDWSVKLALDEGIVAAHRRSSAICEVELELARGEPAALFSLARRVQAIAPVRVGVKSKAERGFELLENKPPDPVKAGKLKMKAGMTVAACFRLVAQDCLHQLVVNGPVLEHGNLEALHQMRVATRRLRACISLFADIVADRKMDEIKSGLKWVAAQLAPARDFDVFMTEAVVPARDRHRSDAVGSGLRSFADEIVARRNDALEHAKQMLEAPRFRDLILDTAEWIATGPWTSTRGKRARLRECCVEKHAERELSRRRRKIKRRGRSLRDLDVRQRHKLRIQAKKVRYAAEFFAGLFPGRRSEQKMKPFVSALKRLQNELGHLNDIGARQHIGFDIAQHRKRCLSAGLERRRAFAGGLLVGEQEARADMLLKAAVAAHRDFARAKPFWK